MPAVTDYANEGAALAAGWMKREEGRRPPSKASDHRCGPDRTQGRPRSRRRCCAGSDRFRPARCDYIAIVNNDCWLAEGDIYDLYREGGSR